MPTNQPFHFILYPVSFCHVFSHTPALPVQDLGAVPTADEARHTHAKVSAKDTAAGNCSDGKERDAGFPAEVGKYSSRSNSVPHFVT